MCLLLMLLVCFCCSLLDLAYITKDSYTEIEKQGASILRKLPAA